MADTAPPRVACAYRNLAVATADQWHRDRVTGPSSPSGDGQRQTTRRFRCIEV